MQYAAGTLAVLLIVIVVVFSIQNIEAIQVSFLFWSVSISKVLLILGIYILGMLTGWGVVELVKRYFVE